MIPEISIIVPVYNVEQYLPKCIESILDQTFTNFELILVNDGSTDNCGSICEEYSKKDNRIKVIHKTNGGLSDARNAGINLAKGNYIGFVDSDDWIEPNMYEVLYNLIKDYSMDISTCKIQRYYEGKHFIKNKSNELRIFDSYTAIKLMYEGKLSGFSACNKLFAKKLFDNIRFPINRIYEDAAIMYKLFNLANKLIFIETPFYNYLSRNNSITKRGFSEKRFDAVLNYQEAYKYMENNLPEMCELLNYDYFKILSNMIYDIVNEKKSNKNLKYLTEISCLMKKENKKFWHNRLIPLTNKLFSQFIAISPFLGVNLYKLRIKSIKIIKNKLLS